MAPALAVTPATAAYRLLCSVLLGGALGIFYGCLRVPGKRHRHLADLAFMGAAVWAWVYLCFAVCRGDIRLIYLLGMIAGLIFWEATVGKWLRPVFMGFWKGIAVLVHILGIPGKKILLFLKILFASAEKWVTIKCTKIFRSAQKRRKESHGTKKHPNPKSESGNSSRIQYS